MDRAKRSRKEIGPKKNPGSSMPWKAVAIASVALLLMVVGKNFLGSTKSNKTLLPAQLETSVASDGLETKILLVASEFICACGKCGRTPLLECSCNQPHGAIEEKAFIRRNLTKGLSIEDVIGLVDRAYGNRI